MDASRRAWPRVDLRVGDADRQAVVAELQRHFVEGRLSSEELSERVTRALSARVFGDFAPLLSDLPALPREIDEPSPGTRTDWRSLLMSPPLGALLLLIGLVAMLLLFVFPISPTGHFGFFPFWPVLIWGFFFIGRPHRGRRF